MVSARPAAAGAHLVVRIEDMGLTATELASRARPLGVAVEPLSFSRHHPAGDQELLIHYGRLTARRDPGGHPAARKGRVAAA